MKDFLRNVRMREFELHEWLDHKLKQVRLEEREACAKVCESMYNSPTFSDEYIECADAIRARSSEH